LSGLEPPIIESVAQPDLDEPKASPDVSMLRLEDEKDKSDRGRQKKKKKKKKKKETLFVLSP
jgi:hypothetical protein